MTVFTHPVTTFHTKHKIVSTAQSATRAIFTRHCCSEMRAGDTVKSKTLDVAMVAKLVLRDHTTDPSELTRVPSCSVRGTGMTTGPVRLQSAELRLALRVRVRGSCLFSRLGEMLASCQSLPCKRSTLTDTENTLNKTSDAKTSTMTTPLSPKCPADPARNLSEHDPRPFHTD